jgi:hypothetical protein
MSNFYLVLFMVVFVFSCKKEEKMNNSNLGKININVKNNNIELELKKLTYTDSVLIKFNNDIVYDCNLYKINYAFEQQEQQFNFVLGNIYYIPGYCILGNFPATAVHQIKDWQNGTYEFNVTKNNNLYTGKLNVSATTYSFDWQYDHILKIPNKLINK